MPPRSWFRQIPTPKSSLHFIGSSLCISAIARKTTFQISLGGIPLPMDGFPSIHPGRRHWMLSCLRTFCCIWTGWRIVKHLEIFCALNEKKRTNLEGLVLFLFATHSATFYFTDVSLPSHVIQTCGHHFILLTSQNRHSSSWAKIFLWYAGAQKSILLAFSLKHLVQRYGAWPRSRSLEISFPL